MIRSLKVSNWRAYDALELEFELGTTFVVAPNGVGKTSLLLALAWGVFGQQSGVSPRDSIRAGAEATEVEVVVELDQGRLMTILRRCSRRGSPKVTYTLADAEIPEAEAIAQLEGSFGVGLGIAVRLATMLGGGHVASEHALDIKDHLYRAFGLTDLIEATEVAALVAKKLTQQRESIRSLEQREAIDRVSAERQMHELAQQLHEHELRRAELAIGVEDARGRFGDARVQQAERERREADSRELSDLSEQIEAFLHQDAAGQAIEERVAPVLLTSEERCAILISSEDEARARLLAAERALEFLNRSDDPTCPTCLRPFHEDELQVALDRHETEKRGAENHLHEIKNERVQLEERISKLKSWAEKLNRLTPLLTPIGTPTNVDSAQQLLDAAAAKLREHDTLAGRLQAELDALGRVLSSDEEMSKRQAELVQAYRAEAIATAAADALSEAVRRASAQRIDPLVTEVQWRWKQLFGREGLQLRPDGSIVFVVGDRELPWSVLSGGERTWARLVTHLLLLGASTRMQFAWFDEPLEHLDPHARRAVAAALAGVTERGGPRQLIVTTYEYSIARQLAEDWPAASVLNLRPSGGGGPDDNVPATTRRPASGTRRRRSDAGAA